MRWVTDDHATLAWIYIHERITKQRLFCSDGEGLAHETSAKIIIHGIQHTYINCQLIQSIVLYSLSRRRPIKGPYVWNANTVISHFISLHVVHSSLYGLLTSLSEVISLLCVVHSLLYVGLTSLHEVHLTIYEARTSLYPLMIVSLHESFYTCTMYNTIVVLTSKDF